MVTELVAVASRARSALCSLKDIVPSAKLIITPPRPPPDIVDMLWTDQQTNDYRSHMMPQIIGRRGIEKSLVEVSLGKACWNVRHRISQLAVILPHASATMHYDFCQWQERTEILNNISSRRGR